MVGVIMASGFTRPEVIKMTGVHPSMLSYWDSTKLIIPTKVGNPKRPTVIYSDKQLLDIKLAAYYEEKLTPREIRRLLSQVDALAHKSHLYLIGDGFYFVSHHVEFVDHVLQEAASGESIVIKDLGDIGDVCKTIKSEIIQQAKDNQILDFDKRIIGTLLEEGHE